VVVLQPGYLPWLGFFDQLREADVFVYYDDVQYDKHGWRNRNRVKGPDGPVWLTVPVRTHGLERPRVNEVEIDSTRAWARRHIGTLRHCYARAPHAKPYLGELEELLSRPWTKLVDLDLAAAALVCRWLGLEREVVRSSELGIAGERTARLVSLCRHFGASRYFSGAAARDYLDQDAFACQGIAVEFQDYAHPVYDQLHGPFVPYLSVLDLIFNAGPMSRSVLRIA
jgi:hypothetical protein